jgi:hypothetical protein
MRNVLALSIAIAACAASCADPVHDNEVSALGPEAPGVSPGPSHRPGQPCLTCHDGTGPANLKMSLGGTVYSVKGGNDPYPNATVHFVDALGSEHEATTNAVGNFYVPFAEWAPAAPVHVSILVNGDAIATMQSHIGRDGSCASCHYDPPGPSTPGRVFVALDPSDLPGASGQ